MFLAPSRLFALYFSDIQFQCKLVNPRRKGCILPKLQPEDRARRAQHIRRAARSRFALVVVATDPLLLPFQSSATPLPERREGVGVSPRGGDRDLNAANRSSVGGEASPSVAVGMVKRRSRVLYGQKKRLSRGTVLTPFRVRKTIRISRRCSPS